MKTISRITRVAATVRDEATLKRELASLQQINDQYPKYILTLDEDPTADYNGIKENQCPKMADGRNRIAEIFPQSDTINI